MFFITDCYYGVKFHLLDCVILVEFKCWELIFLRFDKIFVLDLKVVCNWDIRIKLVEGELGSGFLSGDFLLNNIYCMVKSCIV